VPRRAASIERTQLDVDGRIVDLTPGMAVTAEIKTGQRRVTEYLPSPILRYKQESPSSEMNMLDARVSTGIGQHLWLLITKQRSPYGVQVGGIRTLALNGNP
jgi:hypothetical protein